MGGVFSIGVDAGGSRTRARAFGPDGGPLGAAVEAGPGNLLTADGPATVARTAAQAAAAAGLAPAACALGVGAAGLTAAGAARLAEAAAGWAALRAVSDGCAAALGAHGGADGGVAIMGTGAVAVLLRDGRARQFGGWGLAVDDLGSGADIGRAALRAALRRRDDGRADTPFTAAALAHVGGAEAAADWAAAARADAAAFAALAPLVFQHAADDDEAAAILDAAAGELSRLVRLLRAAGAPRISALGSVAQRLAPRLPAPLRDRLSPAMADATAGAAAAARREVAP